MYRTSILRKLRHIFRSKQDNRLTEKCWNRMVKHNRFKATFHNILSSFLVLCDTVLCTMFTLTPLRQMLKLSWYVSMLIIIRWQLQNAEIQRDVYCTCRPTSSYRANSL